MRPSPARIVLGVLTAALLLGAAVVDLPALSQGELWGDGATYLSMALSLAHDGDLRYEPRDLLRFEEIYAYGPHGLFLKQGGGGRLYFAKPLAYPLAAAPLVRLLGGIRGLLMTNALSFALALCLGFAELRRRGLGESASLVTVVGVFGACVAPIYVCWLTPEAFGLALITVGLVLWSRGQPLGSALVLGLAAYSKPSNILLTLPLLLEPLLSGAGPFLRGLRESARRGAVFVAVVASFFILNWAFTGEANYQGGDRKTFYSNFPYETPEATFEAGGIWMTTEHVGPFVAGEDDARSTARTGPPRPPDELRQSFARNLGYFWIGRFGGAAPYFPGMVLGVVAFVVSGRRSVSGWLCLLALASSAVFFIWLIPDNWYGGGGALGNRYFLNLLPLGLFLLPRGREAWVAVAGGVLGLLLLAPVFASPIRHSLHPGAHSIGPGFGAFPAELTMLNDLSVFTDVWRKRRPYGDGPAYHLYFLDDGTYGQESSFGREGFWLRGGQAAEVVLCAPRAPSRVTLRVTGGPAGDIVDLRVGGERRKLVVAPLKWQEAELEPGPGFPYYGTELFRMRLVSRGGGSSPFDPRALGAFITIRLE